MRILSLAVISLLLSACVTTQDNYTIDELMNVHPSSGVEKLSKWQSVKNSLSYDKIVLKSTNQRDLIEEVNTIVNDVKYVNDKRNYNTADYWATPSEFFERGGDCEDYALAKYTLLRNHGILEDDMRIAVVKDTHINDIHAVLIVKLSNNKYYMLDNQTENVVESSKVTRYASLYHINKNTLWRK